jgi:MFS family permease
VKAAAFRPLLLDPGFAPLFWCQSFAAFNDNFLKTALIMLILYQAGGAGPASLVALAGAVFTAPFLIVSGLAGELADRYDKALIASRVKLTEIAAAALAVAGFLDHSIGMLFAALAGFGVLAALFGPVKYGLLPDLLEVARLPAANALIESATFLAILFGTALGGWLGTRSPILLGAIVMAVSLAAFAMARLIPRPGAAQPGLPIHANPAAAMQELIRSLRSTEGLWRAALISCWFWLAGMVALTILPVLVKQTLHRGPGAVTIGLTAFSLGIGGGSWLAARLARGRIMLAHSIAGTALLGAMMLLLGLLTMDGAATSFPIVLILLFLIAGAGALIAVPSFAAIQAWAGAAHRARAVAGTNILSAAAMVGGTLALAALFHDGVTPPALLIGFGILSLALAVPLRRYVREIGRSDRRSPDQARGAAK